MVTHVNSTEKLIIDNNVPKITTNFFDISNEVVTLPHNNYLAIIDRKKHTIVNFDSSTLTGEPVEINGQAEIFQNQIILRGDKTSLIFSLKASLNKEQYKNTYIIVRNTKKPVPSTP